MKRGMDGVSKGTLLAPFLFLFLFQSISSFEHQDQSTYAYDVLVNPTKQEIDKVFFTPDQGEIIERSLVGLIQSSSTIYAALYLLTNKSIINALIMAKKRGAEIYLVVDRGALNSGTNNIYNLPGAGIPLHLYQGTHRFRPLMHHKYMLFEGAFSQDRNVVVSGSMNFTQSGLYTNEENLTFRDNHEIFSQYHQRIEKLVASADILYMAPKKQTQNEKNIFTQKKHKKRKQKKIKGSNRQVYWAEADQEE
jgi:phosphatidylserine/phosphatidylglycerophosphate/cardiolipin synthase-like enzyme